MGRAARKSRRRRRSRAFDVQAFLETAGVSRRIVEYGSGDVIYAQEDPSDTVMYIQRGTVKLSVLSKAGREAVVAMLGPGEFFGEGALAGQPVRMGAATAMSPVRALVVQKRQMLRVLHQQRALADRFIAYLLARNTRIEEDLVDHLFNPGEKRLARALLLLARYGRREKRDRVLPRISQQLLADMVGTTRSRVNLFMNKFRKLGFVDYNGTLRINDSLVSVVLHE